MKNIIKTLTAITLTAALGLAMCACGQKGETEESSSQESLASQQMTGSWNRNVSAEDEEAAKQALVDAAAKVDGFLYEYTDLVGTQLVSGTNYAILCTSTTQISGQDAQKIIAYVYVDLEGNADIIATHILSAEELENIDSFELDISAV